MNHIYRWNNTRVICRLLGILFLFRLFKIQHISPWIFSSSQRSTRIGEFILHWMGWNPKEWYQRIMVGGWVCVLSVYIYICICVCLIVVVLKSASVFVQNAYVFAVDYFVCVHTLPVCVSTCWNVCMLLCTLLCGVNAACLSSPSSVLVRFSLLQAGISFSTVIYLFFCHFPLSLSLVIYSSCSVNGPVFLCWSLSQSCFLRFPQPIRRQ